MFYIFGFYKFTKLKSLKKNKVILQKKIINNKVRGTIILSKEGINGTVSGKIKNVNKIKYYLKNLLNFKNFDSQNNSTSKFNPFHRGKIKIKKEVVPIGMQISSIKYLDNYVTPKKWNKLLKEKHVKIVDVRKPFEYSVGTFKGSINPNIENFRNFPEYLKNIDKKESLWKGECYVFDNRISVKHKLKQGSYSMCSGCRKPVSLEEKKSNKYIEGISCPKCHDLLTDSQKSRFAMRQKQILIAKKMGKNHIFQKEF